LALQRASEKYLADYGIIGMTETEVGLSLVEVEAGAFIKVPACIDTGPGCWLCC